MTPFTMELYPVQFLEICNYFIDEIMVFSSLSLMNFSWISLLTYAFHFFFNVFFFFLFSVHDISSTLSSNISI